MIRRLAVAVLLAAVIALPATAQDKTDKVVVGVTRSVATAPYYIAVAKGYLAAEHIEGGAANFRGAQDAVSAVATGDMDVDLGAINAGFLNAENRGLDLRVVAALGIQPLPVTATPLIVRKELWDSGAIRTGADLKGRKVAVNTPGAIPEYLLTLILQKYGMTLKDVDETSLGFPQQPIALQNGGIDMGFVPEPFATTAIRDGTALLLAPDAGVGAGDITTMVFFSGAFMRERRAVAVRFLRALLRGAADTQGDYTRRPEIAALLAKATGLKLENIAASTPFVIDPLLDIAKNIDSLRRQEKIHMANGQINYSTPAPLDKLIDASLIHEAAGTNRN
jgi:NitT/TauT family transport system substrate-binding protein